MLEAKNNFMGLAEIFQDGMVLQRRKPIAFFGESENAQHIRASINGKQVFEGDISEGKYHFTIVQQEAAEDVSIVFQNAEGAKFTLDNVDIGEVWVAGGQSNMEFPLLCERNGEAEIDASNDTHLRYYEVGKYAFEGERAEKLKDDSRWNNWRRFVPEECTHFSAVATYFAKKLRKELNVPVGIVSCCWGGTIITAWMDDAILRAEDDVKDCVLSYERMMEGMDLDAYYKRDREIRAFMGTEESTIGSEMMMKNEVTEPMRISPEELKKLMSMSQTTGPNDKNRPAGLYLNMLSKITGFSTRGVIWYQGESDDFRAPLYGKLFTKLIECWRRDWKEELPFVFVQVAPWQEWMGQNGQNYPELRAQQQAVEDCVPGTYMASIMDAGSQYDIHPKVKGPVGERLALLALAEIYHIELAYAHAPRIAKVFREGQIIRISFD